MVRGQRFWVKSHPNESVCHPFGNATYASWAKVPLWLKAATWALELVGDWCDRTMMRLNTYW